VSVTDEFQSSLVKYLPGFDLSLTDEQIRQCLRHYELMLKWNRSINLSRITDPDEAARYHYCESFFASRFLSANASVADLGSGAGFPGIPLSILNKERTVKLVDSNSKKAIFLKEAVRSLALSNTTVICERFENVDINDFVWVTRASEKLKSNLATFFKSPNPAGLLIFIGDELKDKILSYGEFGWQIDVSPIPLSKSRFIIHARRCFT